jgi:glycosyltransferase involved in cell wall biosynthesis
MSELPNVSVIVPVYNAQETIRECISSLLELNYPKGNLELIFVNNASTDKTPEILKQYCNHIRILHEAKKGPGAARNTGVLNARGEVIAFTDSDCVVDRDWLLNLIPSLQDPCVGIVGGTILAKRPCNEIERFGEAIHDHDMAINLYKPPAVITMNWTSRLSVLKEVNLFDESFTRCEDVDLSYRILQSGYRFAFKPQAVIYHRNESTYSGLFREGFLHGLYAVQTIKKHRDFLSTFGHRKFNGGSYTAILSSLIHYLLGKESDPSMCYFVFNAGKKIGKMVGSIRFRHLDL